VTTATENKKKHAMKKQDVSVGLLLLKMRTFVMLILLIIFFAWRAENFLTPATIVLMARHVAVYAFLAIGMTFVIITGGIDLSVGAIVGLAGMVAGGLIYKGLPIFGVRIYFRVWVIVLITLGLGVLIGAISGLLITRFNVAPFIGTLGVLYIARGAALLVHEGQTYPNLVGDPALNNTGFPIIGAGTFLRIPFTDQGIPFSIWLMIIVAVVAAYIAAKTPRGRHIYAVGGNERAATLSGVRVNNIKMFVYMFSGFCSAIGGLIWASQLVASHPMTGETFELHAIAAAVLGGTSLSGGRGTIGGTIVGAFVIGILEDGMVMMGVSSFWKMVVKGIVIIVAVVVDQLQQKMQQKAALQQQN
jgi:erythritol transport system permease protein